ncbi:carbonic anhydrase 6 [Protobothrops mucrosquamatus]|uniref:carbonic anhydrase 6 n=1 Tax=Protobothrops mucrosquamatus TaxID=103944 RepID=UPI0007758169|nr:carbonic anhydrase 6 [Protobothrops mucrosquamatus]
MRTSVWVLQLCFLHLSSSDILDWTYHGEHSEDEWGTYFEHCLGKLQSPINIQRSKARFNPDLEPLQLQDYGYRRDAFKMTNNGHSVVIDLPSSMRIIKGLPGKFTAIQLHLHWGGTEKESSGSEHTIDGLRYMAELHIVHYNSEAYSSFDKAKNKPDGLAVLAFLFVIDLLENTLVDWKNESLRNDYRQIQPLNKRVVKASFSPRLFEGTQQDISSKLNKIQTSLREMKKYLLDVIGRPVPIVMEKWRWLEKSTNMAELNLPMSPIISHGDSGGHHQLSLQAFHFPLENTASYVTIVPLKPIQLKTFTLCFWVQNSNQGRQTVLFYSTPESENELVVSVGMAVGVWIGGKFVQFDLHRRAEDWVHHCVTWVSSSGTINLWVNGAVGTARNIQRNYVIQSGGTPILGKRKNAMLDVFADAFSGWMSHVNLWSWLLDHNDIQELTLCKHSQQKGDVLAWGETHMSLFGGVTLGPDTSCR